MNDINNACLTLAKISATTAELFNLHSNFNKNVHTHKWQDLSEVYSTMNHAVVHWGKYPNLTLESSLRKQIDMLQNHCLKPFTFTTKEFDEVLELIKLRNDAGHEYFRSWVDLNQRKDKLFQAGDPNKWEIDFKEIQLNADDISKNKKIAKTLMLPGVYFYNKASHNLKQMQKVFGFLNTQLLDQSHFHALKRAKRYIKAMTELSNEMIQHFAESTSNFRDLSNNSCKIFENIATKEQEINDYILQGLEIPKSPPKTS